VRKWLWFALATHQRRRSDCHHYILPQGTDRTGAARAADGVYAGLCDRVGGTEQAGHRRERGLADDRRGERMRARGNYGRTVEDEGR
jgi:hypothetical protein